MFFKSYKFFVPMSLFCLFSGNIYADHISLENQVCGTPVFGIGYVFEMQNLRTRDSKTSSLAEGTVCLPAQEWDVIYYKAIAGATIGYFTVGAGVGQIPLGGGLYLWGTTYSPDYKIYPSSRA